MTESKFIDNVIKGRVLHINDAENGGGAEAVFRDTVEASRRLGYGTRQFTADGFKRTPISYIYSIRHYIRLKKELQQYEPTVVHIHNYYHALSPSILAAIRKYRRRVDNSLRVIMTAHDYHLICPNSGLQYFESGVAKNIRVDGTEAPKSRIYDRRGRIHSWMKRAQRWFAYRLLKLHTEIDLVISPSEFLRDTFKNFGLNIPIVVVRNPINQLGEAFTRHEMGVDRPEASFRLCFVGRLSPEKGLSSFLHTLSRLAQSTSWTLDVFGEGDELEHLVRTTSDLSLGASVVFHGSVERSSLWSSVSDYDALVLPSTWYENAPLVLLEAASMGLPTLASDLGGCAELGKLVTHGRVCRMDDEVQVQTALVDLAAARRRNRIIDPEEFTMQHYMESLDRLYHQPR